MKTKWTWILLALIIIDSITTYYVFQYEACPLLVWTMKTFKWNLATTMVVRVFYCLPFIVFLDYYKWTRFTFFAYIGVYVIMFGKSFI